MVSDYGEVVSAMETLVGGLAEDDRDLFFGGTAGRVYDLR
jgi:hypothetical protein